LKKKIKPKKGKILDPKGNQIGEHDGIYYYTIGQRLGPRYGFDIKKSDKDKRFLKRWYVAKKDVKKNIIIAAPEGHSILLRKEIYLKNPHWINPDEIESLLREENDNKLARDNKKKSVKSISLVKNKSNASRASLSSGRVGGNKTKNQSEKSIKLHARIRQVGELLPCEFNGKKVILNKSITGVSEGQAIVLYKGKKVLGGGEIGFK
jgi:tRNA U34 2-thiouridine synthase MnmA/TrmU